jgi:hypothetical protein
MNTRKYYIIESTLKQMISEAPAQETDNAPMDASESMFTPAEKTFLGKFDARGTSHLGIIYSVSDIGIREFIARSGKDLNLTPQILLSLLKRKIVKLVPYTGWGRNDDYTIELQLDLDDIKGLGDEERKSIESGTPSAGGAAPPAAPEAPTPPAPAGTEVSWVVKYGDILKESVNIAKNLLSESKNKKTTKQKHDYIEKTRIIQRLPKEYIKHIDRVIQTIDKKTKTTFEKERMIADILDILQLKLNLTPKQIRQSYEFHKSQKRLQKFIEK